MLKGGMATNGIELYGSDSRVFPILVPLYQQCIKMYDANGQYLCAQLKALPIQMEEVNYSCKKMEEVVPKYHKLSINGFGRTALMYMNIEMNEEFQYRMDGYSPIIERCESQMDELGPFEIEHMKKIKNGQFSLPLSSTPKLVFKLSWHNSVEYFPCLLGMIRLWDYKVNKIYPVVPC